MTQQQDGLGIPVHPISSDQFPRLPDKVMTETVVGFLSYELASGLFIDVPRRNEDAIGPEQHFWVAMAPREAEALFDEARAQA